MIFGPSLSLFATWPVSVVTMTRVALGEFDNIYPLMVEINDAAAFMIIVTYQVLGIKFIRVSVWRYVSECVVSGSGFSKRCRLIRAEARAFRT